MSISSRVHTRLRIRSLSNWDSRPALGEKRPSRNTNMQKARLAGCGAGIHTIAHKRIRSIVNGFESSPISWISNSYERRVNLFVGSACQNNANECHPILSNVSTPNTSNTCSMTGAPFHGPRESRSPQLKRSSGKPRRAAGQPRRRDPETRARTAERTPAQSQAGRPGAWNDPHTPAPSL